MARIGVIADVHIGNHRVQGGAAEHGMNRRCKLAVQALALARDKALAAGCDGLVICGDLFDDHRPSPQVIAAVADALRGILTFIIPGNHDCASEEPDDNALAPLDRVEGICVVQGEPRLVGIAGCQLLLVPYLPREASEYIAAAAAPCEDAGVVDALVVHAGIRDGETAHWLAGVKDSIDVQEIVEIAGRIGARRVFAGNWHNGRVWERKAASGRLVQVSQCGALAPTGFDNPGNHMVGQLLIWNSGGEIVERVDIQGPRFTRKQDPYEAILEARSAPECHWHSRIECKAEALRGVRDKMNQAAADFPKPGSLTVQVIPAADGAVTAARAAAKNVTGPEAAASVVEVFVAKMELPPGVDRAVVLSKVKDYLAKAV